MNIYVGNLPLKVTKDELWREFVAFGQVVSVSIMNDKYIGSGQPRGYGFVEMVSKDEAESAVNTLNGKILCGRVIEVITALPLSDKRSSESSRKKIGRFNAKGRQRVYQINQFA